MHMTPSGFSLIFRHIYSVIIPVQSIHPSITATLLSNPHYSVSKRARRNSARSSEDSRFKFFCYRHSCWRSKYRRTEGTRACREMGRWVHSLVYSTPAAARHGIIMSWTNKENAGGRARKVTKYRMIRWGMNEVKEGYPA
jgi:hypothetical protein